MSEQAFDSNGYPLEDERETGALVYAARTIGAILSIALVSGLGVWSYRLTLRDVTDVPVVRAMTGAYRVAPEDPGGELAEHRGLAVNSVQSDGGVAPPADRVVLAPPPVSLSDDDTVMAGHRPVPRLGGIEDEPRNVADVSSQPADETEAEAIERALRQAVAEDSIDPDIARLPGVKRSPRPKARVLVAALAGGRDTAGSPRHPVATETVDVDPSTVPAGARLVQLGAFDSREDAIREWDHLMTRHDDLIGGRQRLIQVAESGGREFFRLRMVGFDTPSDSRRLCSALLARGTPCIPVTAR
ncbi:MAG: SPOR domain-containing protein [Rhodobacteraceae bacterium]|nr:SPOR domain-containing protein [Paracoccaceae bacterium]